MFLHNLNKSNTATSICFLSVPRECYSFLPDKQYDNMLWGSFSPLNRILCGIFSQSCWSSKSADSLWKKVYSANKSKDAPQDAPNASMDRLNFVETCRKVAWTVFHSPSACSKSCFQGGKNILKKIVWEWWGEALYSLSEWDLL